VLTLISLKKTGKRSRMFDLAKELPALYPKAVFGRKKSIS